MDSVQAKQLGCQHCGQAQAQYQGGHSGGFAEFLADGMEGIHVNVANAGNEVVQVSPDQRQRQQFEEPTGDKTGADAKRG